jgi:hypothetical protein
VINEFIERPAAQVVQGLRTLLSYDSVSVRPFGSRGTTAVTKLFGPFFEGKRFQEPNTKERSHLNR